ncbi:MAG: hypothetical protein JXA73_22290 [Acidobacteria bacterium]|nr:hypothetical protein [Acidobacteriota bacterium]
MKHSKRNPVFWEMVLLIGSIPVFRGLWMLCDAVDFLNSHKGVAVSFCVGILLCVVALFALNRDSGKSGAGQDQAG